MTARNNWWTRRPLTDPRALLTSLTLHTLFLLFASSIALTVLGPRESTPALQVDLGPVDNRAPDGLQQGGGGPGELGGFGPPVALPVLGNDTSGGDPAALVEDMVSAVVPMAGVSPSRSPSPENRGVGVVPGSGLGGGGGYGGGSGGGIGRGYGPSAEFFGARDQAHSFAYVIDRSGSMSGHHALDWAKEELLASLASLPPDTKLAVLFYNLETTGIPDAENRPGLMFATSINKDHIKTALSKVRPTGGTDHALALREAIKTGAEVIFFLTDAQQLAPEDALTLREEAGTTRVHAIEFGIGPETAAPNALKRLALESGGIFRYVDLIRFHALEK